MLTQGGLAPAASSDENRPQMRSVGQMRKWETQALVPGSPSAVLELLTEPDAIAEWAPVPFEIVSIDVQYVLRPVPGGSDVTASVSVDGSGLLGRVLARATEALLAAGVLRSSVERLGRQLQPVAA
jgi:hypothetical protein